jgi:hypothetical protein
MQNVCSSLYMQLITFAQGIHLLRSNSFLLTQIEYVRINRVCSYVNALALLSHGPVARHIGHTATYVLDAALTAAAHTGRFCGPYISFSQNLTSMKPTLVIAASRAADIQKSTGVSGALKPFSDVSVLATHRFFALSKFAFDQPHGSEPPTMANKSTFKAFDQVHNLRKVNIEIMKFEMIKVTVQRSEAGAFQRSVK